MIQKRIIQSLRISHLLHHLSHSNFACDLFPLNWRNENRNHLAVHIRTFQGLKLLICVNTGKASSRLLYEANILSWTSRSVWPLDIRQPKKFSSNSALGRSIRNFYRRMNALVSHLVILGHFLGKYPLERCIIWRLWSWASRFAYNYLQFHTSHGHQHGGNLICISLWHQLKTKNWANRL